MAAAKKCDRCGKYYEKNENKFAENNTLPITKIETIRPSIVINNGITTEKIYDLCDDCVKAFFEFMNVNMFGGSEND